MGKSPDEERDAVSDPGWNDDRVGEHCVDGRASWIVVSAHAEGEKGGGGCDCWGAAEGKEEGVVSHGWEREEGRGEGRDAGGGGEGLKLRGEERRVEGVVMRCEQMSI